MGNEFAGTMLLGSLFQVKVTREKKELWNCEDLCCSFGLIWRG